MMNSPQLAEYFSVSHRQLKTAINFIIENGYSAGIELVTDNRYSDIEYRPAHAPIRPYYRVDESAYQIINFALPRSVNTLDFFVNGEMTVMTIVSSENQSQSLDERSVIKPSKQVKSKPAKQRKNTPKQPSLYDIINVIPQQKLAQRSTYQTGEIVPEDYRSNNPNIPMLKQAQALRNEFVKEFHRETSHFSLIESLEEWNDMPIEIKLLIAPLCACHLYVNYWLIMTNNEPTEGSTTNDTDFTTIMKKVTDIVDTLSTYELPEKTRK